MKKQINSLAIGEKTVNSLNYKPCEICQRPADDIHHVFAGRLRQLSEQYEMVMNLCRYCHQRLHGDPSGEWLKWKKVYQQRFEKEHGKGEFLKVFGRSYT